MGIGRDLDRIANGPGNRALIHMQREQAVQHDLENRSRAEQDPVFARALAEQQVQQRGDRRPAVGGTMPSVEQARARRDAAYDRLAECEPVVGGMRTTLIVLAVLLALTVVGLPMTALIAYYLHMRSPASIAARRLEIARRHTVDCEAEARKADELGLPQSASMWRACAEL